MVRAKPAVLGPGESLPAFAIARGIPVGSLDRMEIATARELARDGLQESDRTRFSSRSWAKRRTLAHGTRKDRERAGIIEHCEGRVIMPE